jgi:hypothetical protein
MYSPVIFQALAEALTNVYWYKNDLRRFLLVCELQNDVVTRQVWDDPQEYKAQIIGKILDELVSTGDEGLGAVRRLL